MSDVVAVLASLSGDAGVTPHRVLPVNARPEQQSFDHSNRAAFPHVVNPDWRRRRNRQTRRNASRVQDAAGAEGRSRARVLDTREPPHAVRVGAADGLPERGLQALVGVVGFSRRPRSHRKWRLFFARILVVARTPPVLELVAKTSDPSLASMSCSKPVGVDTRRARCTSTETDRLVTQHALSAVNVE